MKLSFIKRGHVAIIALLTSFFAQAQDEFSRDVTYLSGKDNFVTVQVTAQAMDKKMWKLWPVNRFLTHICSVV